MATMPERPGGAVSFQDVTFRYPGRRAPALSHVALAVPAGATLVQGKRRVELPQLEGRAYKHTGISFWPDPRRGKVY